MYRKNAALERDFHENSDTGPVVREIRLGFKYYVNGHGLSVPSPNCPAESPKDQQEAAQAKQRTAVGYAFFPQDWQNAAPEGEVASGQDPPTILPNPSQLRREEDGPEETKPANSTKLRTFTQRRSTNGISRSTPTGSSNVRRTTKVLSAPIERTPDRPQRCGLQLKQPDRPRSGGQRVHRPGKIEFKNWQWRREAQSKPAPAGTPDPRRPTIKVRYTADA